MTPRESDIGSSELAPDHTIRGSIRSAFLPSPEAEVLPMRDFARSLRTAWRRLLRSERGFTLIELTVTMSVLSIVLGALTASFVSASASYSELDARATSQVNAQIALRRTRSDLHCAVRVESVEANGMGGFTLTLTENGDQCATVSTDASLGVKWCTRYEGPKHYSLFRDNVGPCDGTGANLLIEDLTTANPWPEGAWRCASGEFPTMKISFPVNPAPVAHPLAIYRLEDTIALRNATVCV